MKFLICQTGDMISTIHSLPVAKILKKKFPDSKIVYLVSPQCSDLLLSQPNIDEFFIYNRDSHIYYRFNEVFNLFRTVKPSHFIFLGGGNLPNFISWLLRIPIRSGLKSRWSTFLFLNKGIRQKRSMVTMHEMEYNLNLLSYLEIDYFHKEYSTYIPEIHIPPSESESYLNLFKKKLIADGLEPDRKLVFLHPSMPNNALNWSSRNYARFVLKLNQFFPSKFLFVIAFEPSENSFLQGFKEIINRKENEYLKNQIFFLNMEEVGIRYYLSILQKSVLFIGPNNFSTHFASIFKLPTVSLFSPIKNFSALRWGPLSQDKNKTKVLVPDVICGEHKKCALRDCPYYECMGKIEVEDVLKQSLKLIDI